MTNITEGIGRHVSGEEDSGRAVSAEQAQREQELTERVVASFAHTENPRLKYLMETLVRYAHAYVREVRLSEE